jgi:hypothetical protein
VKRTTLPLACLGLFLLAASATFAAETPAAPSAAPVAAAVTLDQLFAPPTVSLLAAPQADDACFAFGICRSCTTTTAKPCLVVQCGTHRTENCGSCTTNCVPPGD